MIQKRFFIPFFMFSLISFVSNHVSIHAETIRFKANSLIAKTSENDEYTCLSGNAEVITDDLEINADEIEITGKEFRFITARGKVSGKNLTSNFTFSCETLHYDRTTKIASLKVNVKLDDTENDVQVSAQSIEYNQETDIALMQIGVRLTNKNAVCTSALALYNKKQQTVTLSGSPKIERDQDIFQAQEIFLDLDTEEIRLDGKIRGSIVNTDDKPDKTATPQTVNDNADTAEPSQPANETTDEKTALQPANDNPDEAESPQPTDSEDE